MPKIKFFITREIQIPKDSEIIDDDIMGAAEDMQRREKEYIISKLGKDYIEQKFSGENLDYACPVNCGARKLHIHNTATSKDGTKEVAHFECYRCGSTVWLYREAEEKEI